MKKRSHGSASEAPPTERGGHTAGFSPRRGENRLTAGSLTLPLFDEPHNRGSYAAWPCWAASQFFSNVMGLT
jgi:hypothetical protein